jgi:cysteine desulfurase
MPIARNHLDLGATESNNLAIKGAAQFYKTKGKHIITVKTEHKAVLDTVRELERRALKRPTWNRRTMA